MACRRATISDVALAAGVSKTTVSRFINGQGRLLSPSTRLRVKTAIERLGFCPSMAARSLSARSSHLVGICVPSLADPACAVFAQQLTDLLPQKGLQSLVAVGQDGEHLLRAHGFQGLIAIAPAGSKPDGAQASAAGFPPRVTAEAGKDPAGCIDELLALMEGPDGR